MKTVLLALLLCISGIALASRSYHAKSCIVHVRGSVTRRGSYHQPHIRSHPDHTRYNNYSHKGNVNPYTGKKGTKR
ncbi:MAG: hypothetical protein ACYCOR_14065 [Acidobacteriaceae bacterium]